MVDPGLPATLAEVIKRMLDYNDQARKERDYSLTGPEKDALDVLVEVVAAARQGTNKASRLQHAARRRGLDDTQFGRDLLIFSRWLWEYLG